jgi:alcohol dehydrogenase class IV
MPSLKFEFHLPTRIVFGRGRIAELGPLLQPGLDRIFVVTDGTIARKTPALDLVRKAVPGKDIAVFDRVEENPSLATVEEAGRAARAFGAQMVIGLGGGSPMDAAKGAALLATNPEPLLPILEGRPLDHDPLPVVAIPTTSGTGSEVTPFAVFTNKAAGQKMGYGHPGIFPVLALIDPELTYTMPASVVVDTGLDVLAHAVEAFLSTISFPLNDALARHAMEVVLAELSRAAKKEPEAMDRMAAASAAAGAAIAHGSTILPHIMGYPLTVYRGVPHGRASAIMLVHVLAALRKQSTCPEKVKAVDALFAACGGLDGFLGALGVSARLSDYGVREEDIPLFARKTIVKGDVKITPADVTVESLERIYRAAL